MARVTSGLCRGLPHFHTEKILSCVVLRVGTPIFQLTLLFCFLPLHHKEKHTPEAAEFHSHNRTPSNMSWFNSILLWAAICTISVTTPEVRVIPSSANIGQGSCILCHLQCILPPIQQGPWATHQLYFAIPLDPRLAVGELAQIRQEDARKVW